ncbi:uncharacterized protein LOC128211237 [Mya arenaria]|uniref:uncharacterized protein LOC128211237 n=1 Tax=Mya arenaria TaxID=6604 RepID=UPI0022E218A8|nr:uncharacterized protein LOC128211237 [Mya arenaria]XP_052771748.1 uncharacterized protein LOC128211237 [Mya arenaria]XP_052771749.1 uncharacterized protein LOC128211237 [Mya arenaria]
MSIIRSLSCEFCHKEEGDLRRCTRCFSVYYCSKECQIANWPNHSVSCSSYLSRSNRAGLNRPTSSTSAKGETSDNKETTAPLNNEDERKGTVDLTSKFKQEYNSRQNKAAKVQKPSTLCARCAKPESSKRCAKCKSVYYCSQLCQKADWKQHKPSCEELAAHLCSFCSEPNCSLRCSRCKISLYCSVNCQRKHWTTHKQICMSGLSANSSDIDQAEGKTNDNETHRTFDEKGPKTTQNTAHEIKKGMADADPSIKRCCSCETSGCSLKCSRCKAVFYCSHECQRQDWTSHKRSCVRVYTEEEQRIIEERQRQKRAQRESMFPDGEPNFAINTSNHPGGLDRFFAMLTPEQCLINEARPAGSLQKAIVLARVMFPFHEILTSFENVPWEEMFPFHLFFALAHRPSVLLAFMFRYHEHAMRHGVYLKDDSDNESHVEFYLDHWGDNPFPFFSYKDVRPGGYLCIQQPEIHRFGDGAVGFRINEPQEVKIIDKNMLN